MAQQKHKKRKHNNRTPEQIAQSERDAAAAKKAEKKGIIAARKEKAENKPAPKGKDGKPAKPKPWTRFFNWCKSVKTEMQRVVWPTRPELFNASVIVIGAIIFFGVIIGIVDNIVIIPLDAVSSLGR